MENFLETITKNRQSNIKVTTIGSRCIVKIVIIYVSNRQGLENESLTDTRI